jgi:hypothetical protein
MNTTWEWSTIEGRPMVGIWRTDSKPKCTKITVSRHIKENASLFLQLKEGYLIENSLCKEREAVRVTGPSKEKEEVKGLGRRADTRTRRYASVPLHERKGRYAKKRQRVLCRT